MKLSFYGKDRSSFPFIALWITNTKFLSLFSKWPFISYNEITEPSIKTTYEIYKAKKGNWKSKKIS